MKLKQWLRAQWDRVGAVGFVVAGLLVLLAGWIGISGKDLPSAQMPYIVSGGIFGLTLIGIGATAWLSADLRDEWRKLDDLHDLLEHIEDIVGPDRPALQGVEAPAALDGTRVLA